MNIFSKNMMIKYRPSACTHPPFIVFYLKFCVRCTKKRLLATQQMICCFPPNNLIDPPPLHYGNKQCGSTARPNINAWEICFRTYFQGWVEISEFFRVFFQRQRKSRGFQGLPGFPGFVCHPAQVSCIAY